METLYHMTNKTIQEIQQLFQQLNNPKIDADAVEHEIQNKLAVINGNCDRLDVLVFKTPVAQRQTAKMRVDQLKYDAKHLQAALDIHQQKRQRREQEATERDQLLSRRFSPNSETQIEIDYSLQHNNSLQNANTGVDEMLYTGSNVLDNLRTQRDTLKGAHKRLRDMGNVLGLSNHTMALIERRVKEDKYVLLGGMLVTSGIIGLIIYYFVL